MRALKNIGEQSKKNLHAKQVGAGEPVDTVCDWLFYSLVIRLLQIGQEGTWTCQK